MNLSDTENKCIACRWVFTLQVPPLDCTAMMKASVCILVSHSETLAKPSGQAQLATILDDTYSWQGVLNSTLEKTCQTHELMWSKQV